MAPREREGIVTPEAVLLEFSEAGIGSRAVAFTIDLVIRAAVMIAAIVGLIATLAGSAATWQVIAYLIMGFGLLIVYPVLFEVLTKGQTPGKMALGLRVVTVEGAPVRLSHASVRAALGLVEFYITVGALGLFSALFSRRNQRLGDLFAGTIVVRERAATASTGAVAFTAPVGWEAFTQQLDVSPISSDMYVLIRDFLLRVNEFRPEQRWRLSLALADQVARQLRLPRPNTYPEPFLVAVIAAYQVAHAPPQLPTAPHTGYPASSASTSLPVAYGPEVPAAETEDIPPTWGRPSRPT